MKSVLSCSRSTTFTTHPNKTFLKRLQKYNFRDSLIEKEMKKIIVKIHSECSDSEDHCHSLHIQLQEKIDDKRVVLNDKRDLFEAYNLHWDEEFH